jgi:hypothetical protein
MAKSRKRRGADVTAPTPERATHDPVERLLQQIQDGDGYINRPFISVDTLMAMERRGTIDKQMRAAAENFRGSFYAARLNNLKSMDLSRPFIQNGRNDDLSRNGYIARERVWSIMKYLGGPSTRVGSALWHVVGAEWSIARWCRERPWRGPPVSQEAASGYVVGRSKRCWRLKRAVPDRAGTRAPPTPTGRKLAPELAPDTIERRDIRRDSMN